jgi:hypothetical protein
MPVNHTIMPPAISPLGSVVTLACSTRLNTAPTVSLRIGYLSSNVSAGNGIINAPGMLSFAENLWLQRHDFMYTRVGYDPECEFTGLIAAFAKMGPAFIQFAQA